MEEIVLKNLFPELGQYSSNPLDAAHFASLPYFEKYYQYLNEK